MPGAQTGQATNKENGILRQINRNEEQGHGRNRMKDGGAGQRRGMLVQLGSSLILMKQIILSFSSHSH